MEYTNTHAGFWRRQWKLSLAQCNNCGFVFNFWHGKWPSLAVKRKGGYWTFRCPSCNKKTAFVVRTNTFDRTQPTYSDASRLPFLFLQIPIAAALLTLLAFSISNFGIWVRFTLLFLAIEDILLVANFVLALAIIWYYSHRVRFERIA